jgi:hypothetical protein
MTGKPGELPLLQASERKLRRNLRWTAALLAAAAAALVVVGLRGWIPERGLGFDIYKLLLQFFLITAGGGVLLAIVGNARDAAIRRQGRAALVYELDRNLDRAYRALRRTKHSLRAHSEDAPAADGGADDTPAGFRISRAPFEAAMEDLLEGKQELEAICEHIGHRDDILYRWRLDRMKAPLDYAKLYYHDVFQDFEHHRVVRVGDDYVIEPGRAHHFTDYLRGRGEGSSPRPGGVDAALKLLAGREAGGGEDEEADERLEKRCGALEALIEASPDGGKGGPLRYSDVAGACIDLLAAEFADARRNLLS